MYIKLLQIIFSILFVEMRYTWKCRDYPDRSIQFHPVDLPVFYPVIYPVIKCRDYPDRSIQFHPVDLPVFYPVIYPVIKRMKVDGCIRMILKDFIRQLAGKNPVKPLNQTDRSGWLLADESEWIIGSIRIR